MIFFEKFITLNLVYPYLSVFTPLRLISPLLRLSVILTLSSACTSPSPSSSNLELETVLQEIKGRDLDGSRPSLYRLRVPKTWIRRDPLPHESLIDTTKPLCEFIIRENKAMIRITIYNFPSNHLHERIPPSAQVARWQRQFESLSPQHSMIASLAFSGYSGLFFKGVGLLKGEETMVLGWSLQLAPEHYETLLADQTSNQQRRADVTLKAVGPQSLMEKHQTAIHSSALSFELIEEIPLRL